MTYTIGDRSITLDALSEDDHQLILAHSQVFKYCLNNAVYTLLLKVKKVVHLYSDVMTIYSTLLRKIPDYDDITMMANKVKMHLMKVEEDLDAIFGAEEDTAPRRHWESLSYERSTKKVSLLVIRSTIESFDQIAKTLNCIEIFFNSFNNLKKLLIPYLTTQTMAVSRCLAKIHYLLGITTIVDDIPDLSPPIVKQLKKIEKITTGMEREGLILDAAFLTFEPSLQQYTRVLLGKAILKRDISDTDCQLIKRREVCFQAAEFVGSIPLTEEQSFKKHINTIYYAVFVFMAMVSIVVYRIAQVVLGK
ncbi:uncharacterized protein CANTADRAFT_25324 [Suhomyces tanzawaensis NRRL Y-17324]|uniref:Uncharacterized protein n=1 Tax=Suhomyces tanzawaensis NRRL Y-17324 TaxID=984487 RepID=A0A1E4SNF1_9ASCO|nr:uncharacterized protein CANTADRAFT_25324 [Suhomyces tanzawaensis NRRL Y-17324]ODV81054.1 hypothetical protein CANTADRAFT_25324 [Suhomyces tanzawaensis NRRL Y-17324]